MDAFAALFGKIYWLKFIILQNKNSLTILLSNQLASVNHYRFFFESKSWNREIGRGRNARVEILKNITEFLNRTLRSQKPSLSRWTIMTTTMIMATIMATIMTMMTTTMTMTTMTMTTTIMATKMIVKMKLILKTIFQCSKMLHDWTTVLQLLMHVILMPHSIPVTFSAIVSKLITLMTIVLLSI